MLFLSYYVYFDAIRCVQNASFTIAYCNLREEFTTFMQEAPLQLHSSPHYSSVGPLALPHQERQMSFTLSKFFRTPHLL